MWMDVFHDSESSSSVNRAIDFTSMSVCVFADFESNSSVSIVQLFLFSIFVHFLSCLFLHFFHSSI